MVLRKTFQNTTNPADGKLAPKWEGPYLIEAEAGKGAYRLLTMEGIPLPRAWKAIHLKKIASSARYPHLIQGNGTSALYVADNFIVVGLMLDPQVYGRRTIPPLS
ncbi:hypothetical protein QVD17_37749 [Tagetes erecta]|uniref:Uncharacterized protein n=1 Tax=Tagetes erecta TaxID=13708 RepID=A0AAD8JWM4_TARER|nr:hypothetical protein QVD17_37749 [Tagetes erecta]